VIASGVANALQQYDEADFSTGVRLLNNRREPKFIGGISPGSAVPPAVAFVGFLRALFADIAMPPFLRELSEQVAAGGLPISNVVRALMAEGFVPQGAQAAQIRAYQSRILPTTFLQKTVSDLYQRTEAQTIQCSELDLTVNCVSRLVSAMVDELATFRSDFDRLKDVGKYTMLFHHRYVGSSDSKLDGSPRTSLM
jgi:hypothetical protein